MSGFSIAFGVRPAKKLGRGCVLFSTTIRSGAVAACLLLLFLVSSVQAQSFKPTGGGSPLADKQYVDNQLIVAFSAAAKADARAQVRNLLQAATLRKLAIIDAELLQISGMTVEAAIDKLRNDQRIRYAEPNYVRHADVIPNDPFFSQLWGMHNTGQNGGTVDADIDAVEAWDIGTGGSVIVGSIDTGVDTAHVDLHDNIWTNPGEIPDNGVDDDGNGYVDDVHGWDFVNWDNGPIDDYGHGTHTSGTVAAVGNNAIGVVGVCWSARIMALKFLDASGSGSNSDAILAVEYATRMGANLTNNSWGGGPYSEALKDAIDSSGAHGLLFVAAAGNSGENNDIYPHYPSSYDLPNIIAVAATDRNDLLAGFSCWGPTSVDLGAPGVDVHSTVPGNSYYTAEGTSMAAPHVAGVAALIWSQYPSLTYEVVKERILAMVDPLPSLAGRCVTGGRLNAFLAMAEPDSIPPGPILSLSVVETGATRVALSWTATGDDSGVGTATRYDIRFSLSPIDSTNFALASQADNEPHPLPAGSPETFVVRGLDFSTTYYFAIKAMDEWGNSSPISNCPFTTTLGPPSIQVTPGSLTDSLYTSETSTQQLTLANLSEGELLYEVRVSYPSSKRASGSITIPSPTGGLVGEAAIIDATARPSPPLSFDITGEKLAGKGLNVLLVYADYGASVLQAILQGYPDMDVVDTWYAGADGGVIPPLSLLQSYDVVVAWNNEAWDDVYAIGDVLADYIDAGGSVVTTVDCWSAGSFVSHGRYFDSSGYSPFRSLGGALRDPRTLGWYDSNHPIMQGVNTLSITAFYNNTALTEGAVDVARWDDGTPLVATNPHTVSINVWPGDYYNWSGDFPTLVHNAINYALTSANWLSVAPDFGEVAPFGSAALDVTFDAADLFGGDYLADILLRSNDPDDSVVTVPAHLHVTGAPEIVVQPDTLNLDTVYIGYPERQPLKVLNKGTDALTVASIAASLPEFSADVTSFTLAPRKDTTIHITFAPTAVGEVTANLSIASNDPDEPIAMTVVRAIGAVAPEIVVSPMSLSDTLFTGGRSTQLFDIANNGGSDLDFRLRIESVEGLSGLVTEALRGVTMTDSTMVDGISIPTFSEDELAQFKANLELFYQRVAALPGASALPRIAVAGAYPAEMQYLLMTDSSLSSRYLFNVVYDYSVYSAIQAYDGLVIAEYDGGVTDGEATAVSQFCRSGKPVLMGMDDLDDEPQEVKEELFPLFGIFDATDNAFLWGTLNHDNPITEGIDRVWEFNDSDNDCYSTAGADWIFAGSDGRYFGVSFDGEARSALMGEYLAYIWTVGNGRLIANAINWMMQGAGWLSVEPTRGNVATGSSADIQTRFNAFRLDSGDYAATILISSNDPATPLVRMPVRLHVNPAPDIALSPDTLDLGMAYITASKTDSLMVSNEGVDSLFVRNVTVQTPGQSTCDYSVSVTTFGIAAGDSFSLPITFSPTAAGQISGALTIESTDPDEPAITAVLLGEGLIPPDISVPADSLTDSLYTGQTSAHVLTVTNAGIGELIYEVTTEAAPGLKSLVAECVRGIAPTEKRVIDGREELTFSESELAEFKARYVRFMEQAKLLKGADSIPSIAVVGDDTWSTLYQLLSDSTLASQYLFSALYSYYDYALIDPYDGVIVSEYGTDVYLDEALALRAYYDSKRPILMGMRGLYWEPTDVKDLLYPSFGISDARMADFYFGSLNPNNDIAAGLATVYSFCCQNDYYTLGTAEWIFAGTDGNYYGVSHHGRARTVLIGGYLSWVMSAGNRELIANAVNWMMCYARWLSVSPSSGTIAGGSSRDLEVLVDAAGMTGGNYQAHVVVQSNDPDEPEVRVPTRLHVTGAADIAVSGDSLLFGSVYIGALRTDSVTLSNRGTEVLIVDSITIQEADFTTPYSGLNLDPGQSLSLPVIFTPTEPGERKGLLTIFCNDPDEPEVEILLKGRGVEPPDVAVAPDSIDESLLSGETATRNITIYNTGVTDLYFAVAEQLLSKTEGPASIGIPPSSSDTGTKVPAAKVIGTYSRSPLAPRNLAPEEYAGDSVVFPSGSKTATVPFYDGFEDGNFDDWYNDGGSGVEEVTSATSAAGIYSFHYYNYSYGHMHGIHQEFAYGSQPTYAGFYVRCGSTVPASGYFVLLSDMGSEAIWFFANQGGHFYVNADVGGDNTYPYEALRWYHVEFKRIDWVTKTFDYYVDGQLVKASIPFRYPSSANGFGYLFLYNFDSYSDAWWDEIQVGGIPWMQTEPHSGTVAPGDSMNVTVTFDAAGLLDGDYHANIQVSSNDPDEPQVKIPVHLHVTGIPDIALSRDSLDFGSVYIGASAQDSVEIRNDGTASLNISSVSSSNPDFTTDTLSFSLAPDQRRSLPITFTPSLPGSLIGTLTFNSNDPDEPAALLSLSGIGVEPPDIDVSPDSFSDTLLTDETSADSLLITNTGVTDLVWKASIRSAKKGAVVQASPRFNSPSSEQGIDTKNDIQSVPPGRPDSSQLFTMPGAGVAGILKGNSRVWLDNLEEVLRSLDAGYLDVIDAIPQRYDFSEGETGYSIMDGGDDMYDDGNYLTTDLAGYWVMYSSGVVSSSTAFGPSGRYFTRKYPGLFVLVADLENVGHFEIDGDLGADGYGSADGATLQAEINGTVYYGFVKRVYNAGDPSVNHLIIIEENLAAGHDFSTYTGTDYHRVNNLSQSNRIYYLLFAGQYGFYIDNSAMLDIMEKFLTAANPTPGFVRLSPDSGTVAPGTTTKVDVLLNATGMLGGDYSANIGVASNDPDESLVTVPAHLRVIGIPRIAISGDSLKYDSVFVGGSAEETFTVANIGTDVLTISNLRSDNANFLVSDSAFVLQVGEIREVTVTFAPLTVGTHAGVITIRSTDPDDSVMTVRLIGEGIEPPTIAVSPDSFAFVLSQGDSSEVTLMISNTGASVLNFEIAAYNAFASFAVKPFPSSEALGAAADSAGSHEPPPGYAPIPSPEKRQSDPKRQAEVLLIQDVYPWGFNANEIVLANNGIAFDLVNSANINSTDFSQYRVIIIPGDQTQSYYNNLALAGAKLDDFVLQGGVMEFHACAWGWNGGSSLGVILPGGTAIARFFSQMNYVLLPNHPLAAGVPSSFWGYPASEASFHSYPVNAGRIMQNQISSAVLIEYPLGAGLVVASGQALEKGFMYGELVGTVLQNLIPYCVATSHVPWLSFAPSEGAVVPDDSASVLVRIRTAQIPGGVHHAQIKIHSNDPLTPVVTVPVELRIPGVADIGVSNYTLNLGSVLVGDNFTETLMVYSEGGDILSVTGMSVRGPEFAVNDSSFDLNPGESRAVPVTFSPTALTTFKDTLTVTSNDPDESPLLVALEGIGVSVVHPDTCYYRMSGGQIVELDSGICDTIRLGCPVVVPSIVPDDSFPIPIYLWSDARISGFTLGFSYNSDMVEITSWSAVGGIIPVPALSGTRFRSDPESNRCLIGWQDFTAFYPIPPATVPYARPLGTLYMRVLPSAAPHLINIDSVFVPPAGPFILVGLAGLNTIKLTPKYVDCDTADVYLGLPPPNPICGDANASGAVDVSDAIYLIAYVFGSGPPPNPLWTGDPNCDDAVDISDVVYLVNYIFTSGPPPCAGC